MAKAKSTTGAKASAVSVQVLERLEALREGIHEAYCLSVCIDYALLYKDSDMDPEIAVCVRKHLVHPLDALSYEVADIKAALEGKPRKRGAVETADDLATAD